jgi:hypothetical protein
VSGGETQRGQASLFWLRSLIDSRFGYYAGEITMPRPSRADEAGGLDHAPNRGNMRAEILHNSLALASIARTRAEAAFTMAHTAIAELRGSRQRTAHRRSSWSLSGNVFRVAVRESDLCPKNKSKRPDPFDFALYLHAPWSQPILDLDSANGFEVPVGGQEDQSVLASERRNQQIELGHDPTNRT